MVVIIGAGISGLIAAYRLQKAKIPYVLLEATDHIGGNIRTINTNGYQLECGPNSLFADDHILGLITELGIADQIIYPSSNAKNRYIFRNGSYRILPSGPKDLLFNNFLSFNSRLTVLKEFFYKKGKAKPGETIADFFTRHFNKEISDYVVSPFVSGIYAGDIYKLPIVSTFPSLPDYEAHYGSVLKGMIKSSSGRRKVINFNKGLQTFTESIGKQLSGIQKNAKVVEVIKTDNDYKIKYSNSEQIGELYCRNIIFAAPAYVVGNLLKTLKPKTSESLNSIFYPPMAMIHTAYPKASIAKLLKGFGGLNPQVEHRFTLGNLFTSEVFKGRCPEDITLFTSFIGGSTEIDKPSEDEVVIKNKIAAELRESFDITAPPLFQYVYKWQKSIPQPDVNFEKLKQELEELEKENMYFAANYISGVSLPDCIKGAETVAAKIINRNTN